MFTSLLLGVMLHILPMPHALLVHSKRTAHPAHPELVHEVCQDHVSEAEAAEATISNLIQTTTAQVHLQHQD